MKVFLGGTCNGSRWRNELIPLLECEYFNPVVEDWTPSCQKDGMIQFLGDSTHELSGKTVELPGAWD